MQLHKESQYLEELQDIMLYEMNQLYKKHINIVNYKKLTEVFNCTERYIHLILKGQRGRANLTNYYRKFKSFYEEIENKYSEKR